MYNQDSKGWKLHRPRLILSITGGAKKFVMPQRIKQAFKTGLVKAAATTNAWLLILRIYDYFFVDDFFYLKKF